MNIAATAESHELAAAIANRELGRDTIIVAPSSIPVPECYTHLVVEPDEPQQRLIDRWTRATRRTRLAIDVGLTPEQSELVTRLTLRTGVNGENARTKGRDQVLNLLSNLPSLAETPTLLANPGLFHGIPAYIVGAGPGLDDVTPEQWERMLATGLVFTVNLASKVGRSNFVVTLESNDLTAKLSIPEGAIQISSVVCHPNVTSLSETNTFMWSSELGQWIAWASGIPGIHTSGSSSTAAAAMAHHLGCFPIVLVGQDLSFPGGQVYADKTGAGADRVEAEGAKFRHTWGATSGAPRPNCPLPTESDVVELPGATGGTVQTTPMFAGVAEYFGSLARKVPLIQTSQRGLAISNAAHWPLDVPLATLRRDKLTFRLNGHACSKFALSKLIQEADFQRYLAGLWSAQDVRQFLDPWRQAPPNLEHDAEMAHELRAALYQIEDHAMGQITTMVRELEPLLRTETPACYSWLDAGLDSASFAQGYSDRHLFELRQTKAVSPVDAVESRQADGASG